MICENLTKIPVLKSAFPGLLIRQWCLEESYKGRKPHWRSVNQFPLSFFGFINVEPHREGVKQSGQDI